MKKEIVIEFERVRVIYNPRRKRPVWCEFCRAEVEPVTLIEASGISGKAQPAILVLIDQGRLHVNQNPAGETFICLDSLLAAAADNQLF